MKLAHIYYLNNPITGIPVYIGKSVQPKVRLYDHVNRAINGKKVKTKKESWILSLLKEGLYPELSIIDSVPESEWEFWEKHYMCLYRSWGFELKNMSEGGDCGPNMTGHKQRAETILKRIESSKNNPNKGKNISIAKKGKKFTEEHKKALSISRKGRSVWNKGLSGFTAHNKGVLQRSDVKIKVSIGLKKYFSENPSHKKIPVLQYDKFGSLLNEWDSVRNAAKANNILESSISMNIRGKSKTSGGYIWKRKI